MKKHNNKPSVLFSGAAAFESPAQEPIVKRPASDQTSSIIEPSRQSIKTPLTVDSPQARAVDEVKPENTFGHSRKSDADITKMPMPVGELEINLVDENVKHSIGLGSICKNGDLEFDGGVIVEGEIFGGSLKVNGTLVLKPKAKVTAMIDCQRLILMGQIDSETVIVRGLVVAWSGRLKAREGIYCDALEVSSNCKVLGAIKDVADLPA